MFPEHQVRLSVRTAGDGPIVAAYKDTYAYLSLAGRTFRANSQNGIIAARVAQGNQASLERRGELLELFSHNHRNNGESIKVYFAKVRWYVDATIDVTGLRPVQIWQFDG
jgi:hypothetical protein